MVSAQQAIDALCTPLNDVPVAPIPGPGGSAHNDSCPCNLSFKLLQCALHVSVPGEHSESSTGAEFS